jgi:hypothetical protein
MFVVMQLRWERRRRGVYHGLSDQGLALAQVALVLGPEGQEEGWMVWLTHRPDAVFERFATGEEAMIAAEAALDR